MLDACGSLRDAAPACWSPATSTSAAGDRLRRPALPGARDYLATYEAAGLLGDRTVLAHDVHVSDDELHRLGGGAARAIAHCPSSNAFLASGIFPMARHVRHGVRFGHGHGRRRRHRPEPAERGLVGLPAPDGATTTAIRSSPAHLLHLATAPGARVLGLERQVGDLAPGKAADFVLVRPPAGSTLETVLEAAPDWSAALGALFTLAREESIREVRVAGEIVFPDAA